MRLAVALALQLAACPPSLACTNLPALQTATTVTVTADPNRPAKWFGAAVTVEIAAFETYAIATHQHTFSQFTQQESRAHPVVRWGIVAGMAALTAHLAFHGPLW